MKTLLLAAGTSQAFADAGYFYPKNLIEVAGTPLLSHVVESLGPLARDGRLVVVVPEEEAVRHHTHRVVTLLEPTATVVRVGATSGAACSALLACESIEEDEPLLIVNGDQVIDADLDAITRGFMERGLDAGVVVFSAVHPRWSYVRLDGDRVVEASEKRPISNQATAGCYWFRRGGDFIESATSMILKDAQVEGRFFVCPSLNEMILRGKAVGVEEISRAQYFSLHDPGSLAHYEQHVAALTGAA